MAGQDTEMFHHMQPKEHAKMRALILHVADRYADDPSFGSVKLNKVLFHADFSAYANLGDSLTRYEYRAQQEGPVLYAMLPVLNEMSSDDRISFKQVDDWAFPQDRIEAHEEPNLDLFSEAEQEVIESSIERLRGMSSDEVTDAAHRFPGWIHAWQRGKGSTIPYESVFWDDATELEDWEEAVAKDLAAELGISS